MESVNCVPDKPEVRLRIDDLSMFRAAMRGRIPLATRNRELLPFVGWIRTLGNGRGKPRVIANQSAVTAIIEPPKGE